MLAVPVVVVEVWPLLPLSEPLLPVVLGVEPLVEPLLVLPVGLWPDFPVVREVPLPVVLESEPPVALWPVLLVVP